MRQLTSLLFFFWTLLYLYEQNVRLINSYINTFSYHYKRNLWRKMRISIPVWKISLLAKAYTLKKRWSSTLDFNYKKMLALSVYLNMMMMVMMMVMMMGINMHFKENFKRSLRKCLVLKRKLFRLKCILEQFGYPMT